MSAAPGLGRAATLRPRLIRRRVRPVGVALRHNGRPGPGRLLRVTVAATERPGSHDVSRYHCPGGSGGSSVPQPGAAGHRDNTRGHTAGRATGTDLSSESESGYVTHLNLSPAAVQLTQ